MHTPRYQAFSYTASTEIQRLHSKWRMVIVSAEVGGKQSHEMAAVMINDILSTSNVPAGHVEPKYGLKLTTIPLSKGTCCLGSAELVYKKRL